MAEIESLLADVGKISISFPVDTESQCSKRREEISDEISFVERELAKLKQERQETDQKLEHKAQRAGL